MSGPRSSAASKAERAAALRASSRFHRAAITLLSMTVVMGLRSSTAQFADRAHDCLPAGACLAASDPAILFERTAGSYRPDLGLRAVAFKDQIVPRLHAEQLTDLVGHGNLALAGDSGLFLHRWSSPYLIIYLLTKPSVLLSHLSLSWDALNPAPQAATPLPALSPPTLAKKTQGWANLGIGKH